MVSPSRITRLFDAIEAGTTSRVTALLDETPELLEASGHNNANRRDKTPLMWALQCHGFGLARTLIQRGANVNARMTGGPRMLVIAQAVRYSIMGRPNNDLVAIIGELIDAGADPTDALWPACHVYVKKYDQAEVIELLLARGADPDRAVREGGESCRRLVEINATLYSPRVLQLFGLG